jgi:hypothetical protein
VQLRTKTGYRCHINDGTAAPLAHAGRHELYETECAFQVYFNHFVEPAFVDFKAGSLGNIGSGVVHKNVNSPKTFQGRPDHSLQIACATYMAHYRFHGRSDFSGDFVQSGLVSAADDYMCPFSGECFRDGPSDAAARPGNQCNLFVKQANRFAHKYPLVSR